MKNKYLSILYISIIYLISLGIAYIVFNQLTISSLILRILIADVVATLIIYVISLVLKNASLYDPYWSVIPPILLAFVMFKYQLVTFESLLLIIPILIWSLRLTYNWAKLWQGFQEMDWRYINFKKHYPKIYFLINLFGIQLMPTLIVYAQIAVGINYLMANPTASLLTYIGAIIIVLAAVTQFISDSQMQAFKNKNKGKKMCIDEGLWKFSRHPNYLGEIMVWWGVYIIYISAFKSLDLWILAPIAMTLLFYYISIPLMENKILSNRPEYAKYQKNVSKLLLLPRKGMQSEISTQD